MMLTAITPKTMDDKMAKTNQLRPLGEVTGDLELILFEMSGTRKGQHGLQYGEVRALIHQWFKTHNPEAFEKYINKFSIEVDQPEDYYGFPRGAK